MKDMEISVGDRLRVRSWESMAAEFGTDDDGWAICCRFKFMREMMNICGEPFTVKEIADGIGGRAYLSEEGTEMIGCEYTWRPKGWLISADMLEPYTEDEELEGVSVDSLFDMLSGGGVHA